jgi:formylglycine-generating enzyme required for sulfatase activity
MIGPFQASVQNGFSQPFPPEQEIVLTKTYGNLRWKPCPKFSDGVVHMLRAPGNGATYLYRKIEAAKPITIPGLFGSDDALMVWLNGKRLLARDVKRGPAPNQDRADLNLQAGANHLLLKIYNYQGDHGFYFSTNPRPGTAQMTAQDAIWERVMSDFTATEDRRQMQWEQEDKIWEEDWQPGAFSELAPRYAKATRIPTLAAEAQKLAPQCGDAAKLQQVREIYYQSRWAEKAKSLPGEMGLGSVRLAIEDLSARFSDRYTRGAEFLQRLEALEKETKTLCATAANAHRQAIAQLPGLLARWEAFRREALLANPLLDFDKLLLIRRHLGHPRYGARPNYAALGLPQNWQGDCVLPRQGFDNELVTLSPVRPEGEMKALFKPQKKVFVGDVDLHFDGKKLLFSMIGSNDRWQIWEIAADGTGLRQVTPGTEPDVDNYDACYLPDGRIIFSSTRCFQGVPCVGGSVAVANLFIMNADGANIRQLTFDQDHNWCPTMMPDGRVLYTRWEYSDSPHYFTRLLFTMNPDGTEQMALYGSNSYWPNSTFYARPIPRNSGKLAAVVSGHHGAARMGELVIFQPGKGRHEASGAVQRIPGYRQEVQPIIKDTLVDASWPKFLHPFPLDESYFLVASQPHPDSLWGIYLVDVFDNMVLIKESPDCALLEPIPLRPTPTPPAIPDKVRLGESEATVYLVDVYAGPGLQGVPRGTVKQLRVYEYHYAYNGIGGHINIGIDGPWDVHRILGTVPVCEDGSALFKVPANTPIAVQPLDSEGKAVQIMRSWFTAMPGEVLSCVGCHESQNGGPPSQRTIAAANPPTPITPWYGPARGFSFKREVQPALDRYCVGCHNGKWRLAPWRQGRSPTADGKKIPDLRGNREPCFDGFTDERAESFRQRGYRGFDPSYIALHPYVRRPGPESDYHLQKPYEFHADTSELIQMLQAGHHNVKLDKEAWDRLITWIDLNVPDHGTWGEHHAIPGNYHERRLEMRKLYANKTDDPEAIPVAPLTNVQFVMPPSEQPPSVTPASCPGWPLGAEEAKRRQQAAGFPPELTLDLGNGVKMEFALIPAGQEVGQGKAVGERRKTKGETMNESNNFSPSAFPLSPFWIGKFEVTNEQYHQFDPEHDSGFISMTYKDQTERGYPVNGPKQPVVRISWQEAESFCDWLSKKTGRACFLPTEEQWEYACRAGTETPFSFGPDDSDFSAFANMADQTMAALARGDSPRWHLIDGRFNDKAKVACDVGSYRPNPWGLYDMHGNVWEWTCSTEGRRAENERRNKEDSIGFSPSAFRLSPSSEFKVVRGGSWYDRPFRCRSASRLGYRVWQPVFNVGLRVACQ